MPLNQSSLPLIPSPKNKTGSLNELERHALVFTQEQQVNVKVYNLLQILNYSFLQCFYFVRKPAITANALLFILQHVVTLQRIKTRKHMVLTGSADHLLAANWAALIFFWQLAA